MTKEELIEKQNRAKHVMARFGKETIQHFKASKNFKRYSDMLRALETDFSCRLELETD